MIARYAFRSLWRNKVRSIVTLLGVASLLFLVSFLISILGGFAQATETDTSHRRLIAQHEISLTFVLPESYWEKIRSVPHVVEVCPVSWFGGAYGDEETFFAKFFVDPRTFLAVATEITVPPEQSAEWVADRRGALVPASMAETYGWEIGDGITFVGDIYPVNVDLVVRAIYTGGEDAVYFHRELVEEALGRPGQVGTYTIQVDDSGSLASVASAVDAMFADSEAPTKTQTEKAFQAGFISMMGNVKGLVARLVLVIGVTILITAANTMAMAMRERTTEMAVLKALGFQPARILGLVLGESVALTGLAALLGVGGFWALTWLIFVAAGAKIPMMWFTPTLTPLVGTATLAGCLVLGVLAGLVPGLVAARRPVIEGLRRA